MASYAEGPDMGLFEPLQPSPYKISPTNHTAYVLVPVLIMFSITAVVVFVKTYTAWTGFNKLRMDDYAAITALGFYLAFTITLCLITRHGLGMAAERLTQSQIQRLSQLYLTSDVLLYPLLAGAKCATALLVILIHTLRSRWIFWAICGIVVAWAVAAVGLIPSQCRPTPWVMGPTNDDTCLDQYTAQIGIKVVDILTDIALAVLPGILFMGVQMKRSKRIVVAFLFGLRIITPVFTALSLVAQRDFYNTPTSDRPFKAAEVALWTSIAAGASLTTACIPSIRRFITDWAAGVSNTIMGDGDIALSAYNQSKSSQNKSNPLRQSLPANKTWVQGGKHEHAGTVDDAESVRGLTDQITQTTDVLVHSEPLVGNKSARSGSRSRGSSEISFVSPMSKTSRA